MADLPGRYGAGPQTSIWRDETFFCTLLIIVGPIIRVPSALSKVSSSFEAPAKKPAKCHRFQCA